MLYKTDANFRLVFVKNELFGFNFSAILALFAMGGGSTLCCGRLFCLLLEHRRL